METTVFSVAKQRLPDKIREYRSCYESEKAFSNGRMTVGDAADVYLGKIEANPSLKPTTKRYYRWILDFIQRSWPTLSTTDVRKIGQRDCENWLTEYQKHYAPSVVNNSIGVLRAVFQEVIGVGARFSNPAAQLSRVRIRPKHLELPSREQFLTFVAEIENASEGLFAALWRTSACGINCRDQTLSFFDTCFLVMYLFKATRTNLPGGSGSLCKL